ncbi:3D domain-containing protein [Bacillus sp. FJAT-49736]|uniref:3D domain-containing protein n=1 Tax=Bacillus sp. FJAT-49736 TaxID=2833582 RepID=UPI001BC8EDC2|nr:3D domain-containing protein [Bacillus sp. FJAT-49736]MBS4173094.1 LysM peptidoglycan-binding domain-containing protein [Bacillus sp. FJAT-49736]
MKKAFTAIAAAFTLTGLVTSNTFAAEYNVKKGDSLWSISKEKQLTVDHLMQWNHLKTDLIYPNQKLTISNKKTYEVKNGDTIWDIAKKYHVTTDQIKKWNKLSADLIHPNDILVVYPEEDVKNDVKAVASKKPKSSSAKNTNQTIKSVKTVKKSVKKKAVKKTINKVKKEIKMKATAYTANCAKCSGITATGINIKKHPEKKVISVDPNIIPLGSKVYVEGYGYAVAADTGGAIKGHKIDIFIPSLSKAKQWGVRNVKVKIID